MSTTDLIAYVGFFVVVAFCVVKVGMLWRVRTALLDLSPEQRQLVTILADNNLAWCLTVSLVGLLIVARVAGFGSALFGRFGILLLLLLGVAQGLVRLGNWFIYPPKRATLRQAGDLSLAEEVHRLRLLLERERGIE